MVWDHTTMRTCLLSVSTKSATTSTTTTWACETTRRPRVRSHVRRRKPLESTRQQLLYVLHAKAKTVGYHQRNENVCCFLELFPCCLPAIMIIPQPLCTMLKHINIYASPSLNCCCIAVPIASSMQSMQSSAMMAA